jgi:hypothetical protein
MAPPQLTDNITLLPSKFQPGSDTLLPHHSRPYNASTQEPYRSTYLDSLKIFEVENSATSVTKARGEQLEQQKADMKLQSLRRQAAIDYQESEASDVQSAAVSEYGTMSIMLLSLLSKVESRQSNRMAPRATNHRLLLPLAGSTQKTSRARTGL